MYVGVFMYVYVCVYIYICVCVCVCVYRQKTQMINVVVFPYLI